MPTGIILKSASHEVSDEVREKNLQAVVEGAGYEVAQPEVPVEPKRDDFKTEEEFETAHVEWQDAQEEKEDEKEEIKPKEEVKLAPKKSRRERAVERATANLKTENEDLRKRLEVLEAKNAPPKEVPKPKRLDFAQDEEGEQKYEDELIAWGVEKAKKESAVKDAEDANKARFEQNIQNYAAQVEEAKDEHPDWDEVVNKDIFIGREVQLAILEQENGAEVIYHLGRHPAYAAKLGEMSPLSAVMEVGRLSARLTTGASAHDEANGGSSSKPKPKVPAPVRTVSTAGSSAALTFAEIAAKPNYPGKAKDLRRAATAGE
jgi:hypothetical protein